MMYVKMMKCTNFHGKGEMLETCGYIRAAGLDDALRIGVNVIRSGKCDTFDVVRGRVTFKFIRKGV